MSESLYMGISISPLTYARGLKIGVLSVLKYLLCNSGWLRSLIFDAEDGWNGFAPLETNSETGVLSVLTVKELKAAFTDWLTADPPEGWSRMETLAAGDRLS